MRIKWAIIPAFLAVAVFLAAEDSQGQGRGGGGFDPNKMFDELAMKTGGTDVIDYSRLPPQDRERMNKMSRFMGTPPPPETGTMTRQQFTDQAARNMEAMKAKGFGGGGDRGSSGGGDRGGFGGQPGGDRGGFGGQPGGFGGQPGGFGGGDRGQKGGFGGPPGGGGAPNSDEDNMRRFKDRDKNGDGKISIDEASSFMRPTFPQHDKNGDGFVDFEEYKGYMVQFNQNMANGGRGFDPNQQQQQGGFGGDRGGFNGGGNFPPPGGDNRDNRDNRDSRDSRDGRSRGEEETQKPVVYRFGKLPKEVPSFFEKYDDDQDGQLGLYEWRRHNEATSKFAEMDLNTDGYLTADEWIRFSKQQLEKKPVAYDDDGNPIDAPSSPRGGGSYGRGGDQRSGGERPSGGGNPFANNGNSGPSRGGPPSRDDKSKDESKNKDDKSKDDRRKGPPSGK